MSGSRLSRPALSTWRGFGGRVDFDARFAAESLRGERPEASLGARHASVRFRQRPERFLKVRGSRFGHGSWQCGT
jgi:hypothetical protein